MARTLAEWWNDRSLRWKGIIVVAFPVVVLLAVTAVFGVASMVADRSAQAYEEAVRVSTAVDRLTNHLSAVEAGLRGYLLTKDDLFLEPYFRIVGGRPRPRRTSSRRSPRTRSSPT